MSRSYLLLAPMLFSAHFIDYQCTACEERYTYISPTSIIPIAFTCSVAGAFWARAIRRSSFDHWSMNVVGFAIACLTLWGIYAIVDRLTTSTLQSKRCPKCGCALKVVGGGFYDGMFPNSWELLVYLLTIAVGYVALTLHRFVVAGMVNSY